MGRPPSRAVVLRDGFYIQVRNKGASSGVKIRNVDSQSMMESATEYMKSREKEVLVLGELKKGVWLNELAAAEKKKIQAKEAAREAKAAAKALAAQNSKPKAKPEPPEKIKPEPKVKVKAKAEAKAKVKSEPKKKAKLKQPKPKAKSKGKGK